MIKFLPRAKPVSTIFLGILLAGVIAIGPAQAQRKFPPELVKFTPHPKNPIFTAGGEGKWDEHIRERGWILKDGDTYKMWYTGYRDPKTSLRLLGYATSPDGIRWTRYPKNPLYTKHWVEDMMVLKHKGKYLMFAEGKNDLAHMLVSDDGIAWKRVGQLDVRMKNGKPISKGPYGTPTVWREKGIWYLFYERKDLGIWLATSKDLKVWTNVQDDPVIGIGPGEYDKDQVALNQIIKYKGRYYAYYHGTKFSGPNANKWNTCVATSTDLLHWEKYPHNPLQPIPQNKSSGILVHDGERFRLYTMHAEVNLHFSSP